MTELNTLKKLRNRIQELEQRKVALSESRHPFIARCNAAFTSPPLTIQFAPHREMVWRKRVKVTGGPQSTVEFNTDQGRAFISKLPPAVQDRYLELDRERVRLNMQMKIVLSELKHLREGLAKLENLSRLRNGGQEDINTPAA